MTWKKKRTSALLMEELIPDAKRRQELIRRLYNNEFTRLPSSNNKEGTSDSVFSISEI